MLFCVGVRRLSRCWIKWLDFTACWRISRVVFSSISSASAAVSRHFSLFSNERSGEKTKPTPGRHRPAGLAADDLLPTYLAADWNICSVLFSASEGNWSHQAFHSTWSPGLNSRPNACFQAGRQNLNWPPFFIHFISLEAGKEAENFSGSAAQMQLV